MSGGLAGLGGAINGLGTFGNLFVLGALPNEGFNGIAVALLGLGNQLVLCCLPFYLVFEYRASL